jgi:hypothetical protein
MVTVWERNMDHFTKQENQNAKKIKNKNPMMSTKERMINIQIN